MNLQTTQAFDQIVIEKTPLIDVRAPIEFEKGAFIGAVNLPLMKDEERRLVGICYKEKGNEEAVLLGHQLVSGEIKAARVEAWQTQLDKNPNSLIYCFRGGLRSQISQQWIYEATGKAIPRLEGGYKAFRNHLMCALEPSEQKYSPILLGGCTGAGKTLLLKNLENAIDLEGLANHRGSSFGKQVSEQPTQINFENNLSYALIEHKYKGNSEIILEDEGAHIGKCMIPKPLAAFFKSGDLVILDIPMEERVHNTLREYVSQSQALYRTSFGEDRGLIEWADYIQGSLGRIKNRLGGERYGQIMVLFAAAQGEQIQSGRDECHSGWIEALLRHYYDPMYLYQIEKTTNKILFKGNTQEVMDFLTSRSYSAL